LEYYDGQNTTGAFSTSVALGPQSSSSLFTTGADTVNFNALTPSQMAVIGGL
jgi:hypothetical protein